MDAAAVAQPASGAVAAPASRFVAVDLLRGLTIAYMILANNNGGDHAPAIFRHADWNGFTPTDLVFPTFLFLVGVSTAIATDARLETGAARSAVFAHALRRSAALFALGIVVNSFPFFNRDVMRVYGVLQRIAVCYLAAIAVHLAARGWRGTLALIAVALIAYWSLLCLVPVPGCGVPLRDVTLLDPDCNLAAWLDRQVFAPAHLYERTRDPEGLLSTLPALATTLIGLLAGRWLRNGGSARRQACGLALVGLAAVAVGASWDAGFPINKKLWTSSYVLFAGGWSLLLLAGFLAIERARAPIRVAAGGPLWQTVLLVFGTNAIVAYLFSELLAATFMAIPANGADLQQALIDLATRLAPTATSGALLYSLAFTTVCWLVVYPLYRRRILVRV
jgi:predicted acyltransferase